jgi:hypothetical protein
MSRSLYFEDVLRSQKSLVQNKKVYSAPTLRKMGSVRQLTLKMGSVSDNLAPRTP